MSKPGERQDYFNWPQTLCDHAAKISEARKQPAKRFPARLRDPPEGAGAVERLVAYSDFRWMQPWRLL
jgi:hypothetical protein